MSWTMLTKADNSQIKIILQTENRIKQRLITKELILITMQLCYCRQTKGNPWMACGKDRLHVQYILLGISHFVPSKKKILLTIKSILYGPSFFTKKRNYGLLNIFIIHKIVWERLLWQLGTLTCRGTGRDLNLQQKSDFTSPQLLKTSISFGNIAFLTFLLLWNTVSLLPIFQIPWTLHPLPPPPPPPTHTHTHTHTLKVWKIRMPLKLFKGN